MTDPFWFRHRHDRRIALTIVAVLGLVLFFITRL
jgi:hypothetical protein